MASQQQIHQFNVAARRVLQAGEDTHNLLLHLLRHMDNDMKNWQAPGVIDHLPAVFDLQPHNAAPVLLYTIKDYVDVNLSLKEDRKQKALKWVDKLKDLIRYNEVPSEVFLHGSIFQGTDLTGSDLDVTLRFADGYQNGLEIVKTLLQQHRHQMGLDKFIKIVGAAFPTIKCIMNGGLKVDISDGGGRQLSLCTGHFLREIYRLRPDAAIFTKVMKQYFMHTSFYGGIKRCLGGLGWSMLVLCGLKHIGVLPAFERFNHGEFGEFNIMFNEYWQRQEVHASTDEEMTDSVLIQRFTAILKWLIETELTNQIFSLAEHETIENPTAGTIIILSPPNDYSNVASMVTTATQVCWMLHL